MIKTRLLLLAALLGAALPPAMSQTPATPATPVPTAADATAADPYLWLEDVLGERALSWVRERNAESRRQLEALPTYAPVRDEVRRILDSKAQIPAVSRRGGYLYNFWRDDQHPRGLWRRTTLDSYKTAEPVWQVLLDLDALGKAEGTNWVWAGATALHPGSPRYLVSLSRGGSDAHVVREYDIAKGAFVDGGFALPEAKSEVEWIDENHVYVLSDFGPGSLTDSGYPRVVKRWTRGTPLASAVTVFEGQTQDVAAWVHVDHTPGFERTVFGRSLDFYTNRAALLVPGKDGKPDTLKPLDKPDGASLSFWRERVLLTLRDDWTVGGKTWPKGALLAMDAQRFLAGERSFDLLFTPTAERSLEAWTVTRHHVVLTVLDNVAGRVEELTPSATGWQRRAVKAPFPGTLQVSPLHDEQVAGDPLADDYLLSYTDFLTPDSLLLAHAGHDERTLLKSRPAFFDAQGMRVEQRFATSKDGTRVPYFIVWPKGATADGTNPTLLYGYGGFEVSLNPSYSGAQGKAWLERGGVYVLANLRGGGEYGPAWHQAALKGKRQHAYDDMAAIAEDLIAQKVTSPRHLGIMGGSNGGLLVGAVAMQRPELFNAVVCQVPLLDMRRYHLLLAGASWMAEYGNPDQAEDWGWISKWSPYQNVFKDRHYPRIFFATSTRDDRVHPGHARKMVARMREQGHDVLYYENTEGGHGGAADNAQRADLLAQEYAFLWQQLGRAKP